MNFFWVNIGGSYEEVEKHKFLWAPEKNAQGKAVPGWNTLNDVNSGDIIFCCRDKKIVYVAVARAPAFYAERPETRVFNPLKKNGFKIDVELKILSVPISIEEFKQDLIAKHNDQCYPTLFTTKGTLAQTYMVSLPLGAGAMILDCLGNEEVEVFSQSGSSLSGEIAQGGFREAVVLARIGQAKFRAKVLKKWGNTCPVTGLSKSELLIASHIVPWLLSNGSEKIDANNGLPLSPSVDKLFDRGYVSFSDNGELLIKKGSISIADLQCLGIAKNARITGLNIKQKEYLARHRKIHNFSE